jgi:serine/threonine protein kinase
MKPAVEHFCNVLARSKLLAADDIRELRQRWLNTAGDHAQDLDRFLAWLPTTGALTEYQVGVVARGNAHQLFLGPYTVQERVGKGRMAGVYRAVHTTGTTVAIKVLPPSKARDPQVLARFQREARLALRLKHPNIVRTFQTGQANNLHFLVMEHLEGEPLDRVLKRRGPLPAGEAARLCHQVLLGLQHLHEQKLIHRDVEPANLMLVGGQPDSTLDATVKILDIGTGREMFEDGGGSELTTDADMLGTPEYMSPEQARDPRTVEIRSDVYSVGCVLYHALAGQPPFNDANRVRLLIRVATEPARPVTALEPNVPDGLEQILTRMLAKDPAQRYSTPARAAAALEKFLAAGAAAVPLEQDPGMSHYLSWLAVVEGEEAANAISVDAEIVLEEAVGVEPEVEAQAQYLDEPASRPAPPPPPPPRKKPRT